MKQSHGLLAIAKLLVCTFKREKCSTDGKYAVRMNCSLFIIIGGHCTVAASTMIQFHNCRYSMISASFVLYTAGYSISPYSYQPSWLSAVLFKLTIIITKLFFISNLKMNCTCS